MQKENVKFKVLETFFRYIRLLFIKKHFTHRVQQYVKKLQKGEMEYAK